MSMQIMQSPCISVFVNFHPTRNLFLNRENREDIWLNSDTLLIMASVLSRFYTSLSL
jgi:hypothetical protein